jgi:hypothetical protein
MSACTTDAPRIAGKPGEPALLRARPLARGLTGVLVTLLLCLVSPACSIKKFAVNKLGDALAEGAGTYASDNDPELIEAAVPFSLKLMESLLAESPRHLGLLTGVASGFTQYAYAFVHL